jgi:hypothetical protein
MVSRMGKEFVEQQAARFPFDLAGNRLSLSSLNTNAPRQAMRRL